MSLRRRVKALEGDLYRTRLRNLQTLAILRETLQIMLEQNELAAALDNRVKALERDE